MALSWDDITSKTNGKIVPTLVDTIYKSSPVFTRLSTKNREEFEGGTTIRQPIMYAQLKGGFFTRGGSFDTSYVETDTSLEFNIKYAYVNATLYGTDNVLNRGPEAAMSYVESKMANAAGAMAQILATSLYLDGQGTISPPTSFDGFAAAIDDGTNYTQYGGITRSDIAIGANQGINAYYNGGNTTFALPQLQTAFGSAWSGAEHVDLITTTQPLWDSIWGKIQPQQRFLEESSDVAKIGFHSLKFNGASVVVDQYAPAGKIWGLNTSYIKFYMSTLPLWQFGFTGWKEAQNSVDVSGQYCYAGNIVVDASRLFFQLSGYTS
jgi:hypothetical protein